jgi:putative transposase
MTQKKDNAKTTDWKEVFGSGPDGLRALVQEIVQEVLEAEMDEAVGAQKSERSAGRVGYRAGYYTRTLVTRVGKLVLRIPQDRQGRFRTEVFERYQRSEKALVSALAEMYVQGVSTRKVKEITEQLCGHEFSAATISRVTQQLDEELKKFARRPLEEEYPYLVLDARYEKIRQDGVIGSQAVQVAIGINWEGRRCVVAVGNGEPRKREQLERVPAGIETAGAARGGMRGERRSPRAAQGDPGSFAGSKMAALLCTLPAQRAGPFAAKKR